MQTRKNRIFYLDELRALAILLVILVHAAQFFPTTVESLSTVTCLSYVSIGRVGVPLFFMLSGALLINKEYTLTAFFKKRLLRVLIPAIFWSLIGLLIFILSVGYDYNSIMLWASTFQFPWFVYAIIGIYLMIPIFNSFIKEYGTKGAEYFLIVWILLMIFLNLNLKNYITTTYLFNNIGQFIGYAILGYYLANKDFNMYAAPMIFFNIIIFIACLIANLYFVNTFRLIIPYYSLVLITESSALFLIFRYMSKYAKYKPDKILSKIHKKIEKSFVGTLIYVISVCSYAIYLMHSYILTFIANNFPIQTFEMIPVVFILTAVISIAIVVAVSVIPKANGLIGIN